MDSRDLAWENLAAGRDRRKVRGTLAASGDLQEQRGKGIAGLAGWWMSCFEASCLHLSSEKARAIGPHERKKGKAPIFSRRVAGEERGSASLRFFLLVRPVGGG